MDAKSGGAAGGTYGGRRHWRLRSGEGRCRSRSTLVEREGCVHGHHPVALAEYKRGRGRGGAVEEETREWPVPKRVAADRVWEEQVGGGEARHES